MATILLIRVLCCTKRRGGSVTALPFLVLVLAASDHLVSLSLLPSCEGSPV